MKTNAIPPPLPPRRSKRKRPGVGLFIGLSAIITVVLSSSFLGAYFLLHPSPSRFVGQAFFLSSVQWNESGSQGDNDKLKIELHNMPPPAPDKTYYVWLLSDKSQSPMVARRLGVLQVDRSNVDFTYQDEQGRNLLATTSRLLITEENRQSTPTQPSSQWSYYAELPQPTALGAIRALLYQEPHLSQLKVENNLNIQFLRNLGKIQEWIFSAKDATTSWGNHDAQFIHRQLVNVLEYLDGTTDVQRDIPPGTSPPAGAASPLPLVTDISSQGSISYIDLIHKHLTELMEAPGVTPRMRMLALESDQALTGSVQPELLHVRDLAKALVSMKVEQLLTPPAQAKLNSMVVLASLAFIGQLDQTTNQPQPGVAQIFYKIQGLAAYDIKPY